MDTLQQLHATITELTDARQKELLDFALFLRAQQDRDLDALMDSIITENLPAFKELAK